MTIQTLSHADRVSSRFGEGLEPSMLLAGIVDCFVTTSIWLFDPEARVVWCTRRCTKPLGFDDPNDLAGKRPREFLPASWAAEREELILRAAREGREMNLLSIISGRRRRVRFRPVRLTPEEGGSAFVLCLIETIDADDMKQLMERDTSGSVVCSRVHDLGVLDALSPRELEVIALLGQGLRSKEIAQALHRSLSTIDGHRERIGAKLGIHDRAELMTLARRAALRVEDAEGERVRLYGGMEGE